MEADLRERIAAVRSRIANACQRCGRDPSTVALVAVTKGVDAAVIEEAVALGLRDLGENRVQEARSKMQDAGFRIQDRARQLDPASCILRPVKWHMIGHLQRNKAKDAVELFEVIHSLDTAALAEALERHAEKQAAGFKIQDSGSGPKPTEVFIQVNVSGEETKFGCPPGEAPKLAKVVRQLPHLRLQGLMTIAPFSADPEQARPHFRRLRMLRDHLISILHPASCILNLSMGMSQDFEAAIEEGADVVRIGTAIFGTS